jgi:hypothetical protein
MASKWSTYPSPLVPLGTKNSQPEFFRVCCFSSRTQALQSKRKNPCSDFEILAGRGFSSRPAKGAELWRLLPPAFSKSSGRAAIEAATADVKEKQPWAKK